MNTRSTIHYISISKSIVLSAKTIGNGLYATSKIVSNKVRITISYV